MPFAIGVRLSTPYIETPHPSRTCETNKMDTQIRIEPALRLCYILPSMLYHPLTHSRYVI